MQLDTYKLETVLSELAFENLLGSFSPMRSSGSSHPNSQILILIQNLHGFMYDLLKAPYSSDPS